MLGNECSRRAKVQEHYVTNYRTARNNNDKEKKIK